MKIGRDDVGAVAVVTLHGVIKLGTSGKTFSEYLAQLLEEDVSSVLLDFSGIDAMDSTGLGELVGYLQRFGEREKSLALLSPPKRILNLLRLTRLDEIFPIYSDRDKALADLEAGA